MSVTCLALLAMIGCDSVGRGVCPAVISPAIEVEVRDAISGVGMAEGAIGLAVDGAYRDTLDVSRIDSTNTAVALAGADERPGTYRVMVDKDGYRRWSKEEIKVELDECGVHTVQLTALLERK